MVPRPSAVNVQTNMPEGLFTNDTRWNGFRWWSQALGFGQEVLKTLAVDGVAMAKIVPDPTVWCDRRDPVSVRRPASARRADPDRPVPRVPAASTPSAVLPGHPSASYPGFVDDGKQAIAALGVALSTAEQRQILTMGYQSDPSGVLALRDAQDYRQDRYVSNVIIKE